MEQQHISKHADDLPKRDPPAVLYVGVCEKKTVCVRVGFAQTLLFVYRLCACECGHVGSSTVAHTQLTTQTHEGKERWQVQEKGVEKEKERQSQLTDEFFLQIPSRRHGQSLDKFFKFY